MTDVTVTRTTWKSKAGRNAIRVIILRGRYSSRKGGIIPAIIVRFEARTGGKMLAPPERFEKSNKDLIESVAEIYHDLDKKWLIEAEVEVEVDDEASLRKTIGRHASAVIGCDGYEFLSSTFPITVSKEIYRTQDGRKTIRLLEMRPANRGRMLVIATKFAGHADIVDAGWGGTNEGSAIEKKYTHERCSQYVRVGDPVRATIHDEKNFQAWLGPVLLHWMPKADYVRFVRGGDNQHVKGGDFWEDGYDHGGTGLPPPPQPAPPNGTAPTNAVPASDSTDASKAALGRKGDLEPALPPIDRVSEAERLRDDPTFGSF